MRRASWSSSRVETPGRTASRSAARTVETTMPASRIFSRSRVFLYLILPMSIQELQNLSRHLGDGLLAVHIPHEPLTAVIVEHRLGAAVVDPEPLADGLRSVVLSLDERLP